MGIWAQRSFGLPFGFAIRLSLDLRKRGNYLSLPLTFDNFQNSVDPSSSILSEATDKMLLLLPKSQESSWTNYHKSEHRKEESPHVLIILMQNKPQKTPNKNKRPHCKPTFSTKFDMIPHPAPECATTKNIVFMCIMCNNSLYNLKKIFLFHTKHFIQLKLHAEWNVWHKDPPPKNQLLEKHWKFSPHEHNTNFTWKPLWYDANNHFFPLNQTRLTFKMQELKKKPTIKTKEFAKLNCFWFILFFSHFGHFLGPKYNK